MAMGSRRVVLREGAGDEERALADALEALEACSDELAAAFARLARDPGGYQDARDALDTLDAARWAALERVGALAAAALAVTTDPAPAVSGERGPRGRRRRG